MVKLIKHQKKKQEVLLLIVLLLNIKQKQDIMGIKYILNIDM